MKAAWSIALSIYLSAAAVLPVSAECVMLSVNTQKRLATVVFEGTVTGIEELDRLQVLATMDVHRVWKGKTSQQIIVYFVRSIDGPDLQQGKPYVVFAGPLNETMRKSYDVPSDPRQQNWVPPCGGAVTPRASLTKELGRSRAAGR